MISKKTISRYKTLRTARSVGVCLLLLFHSVLLHADVIPGRWEKVEAQKQGTVLTVIMKSGDRFDCTFEDLQMDTLVVETGAGEQRIPKVDIQRLETSELVPDSVKDGTVKGVVIGAVALGVLGGVAGAFPCSGSSFCSTDTDERIQGALVVGSVGAAIGAGVGAAIGYGIDKAADNKRPEVLYIAR